MKVTGYILIAIGCFLFMSAWQNVARQDQIIRGDAPIQVTILDKRVKQVSSGSSPTYSPSIVYSYKIGRNVYHSDHTLPVDQTRSDEHWADSILSGYTIGKTYTGYYDPADYQKSFLVRRYTIAFYLPLFFSLPLFLMGAFGIIGPFEKASPLLKSHPNSPGWYEIAPEANIRAKVLTLQVCTGIWWFVSFVILGSYAMVAQPYLSNWFWIASAAVAAIGAYPTISLFKTAQAADSVSDVLVLTDVSQVVLGQEHKLKILVNATKECTLKTLQLSILCRQVVSDSDGSQTSTLYEKELSTLDRPTNLNPRQPFTLEEKLCAPASYPKTSSESGNSIKWDIVIKLSTEDGGAIDQRYPFVVHDATSVAKA